MHSLDVRDSASATRAELARSLEGQLIAGKYRVERLIGVGGMGVVVSALHVDLERYVAIKLIRDELTRDSSTLQRFLLEARAAAKMTNEHVCRVLDVDKLENGTPFIVMELLHGSDLGAILEQQGPVAPVDCVDWLLQACEGVAEAHSLHIVHRDLKPDNLFMTRLGDGSTCIKVLDFGISKAGGGNSAGSVTAPRTMVGSPRYMAPEQMLFSAADERSDVWALGTILYELASGTPAFVGDTVVDIFSKVINEPPIPPRAHAPEIPAELQRVILRCLEREPNARYANVAALAQDLAPLGSASALASARRIVATLGGLPSVSGTPRLPLAIDPSAAVVATRAARRSRRWLWGVAALGVAAALIGTRSLWLPAPRGTPLASAPADGAPHSAPDAEIVRAAGHEPDRARASEPVAAAAAAQPHASAAVPAHSATPPSVRPLPGPAGSSGSTPSGAKAARDDRPSARPSPPSSRAEAPSRPEAPTSNAQEAWDVSKFGGRE